MTQTARGLGDSWGSRSGQLGRLREDLELEPAPEAGGLWKGAAVLRPRPTPRQVNLVSEHIWCEDFLVRSFYLKNVQTQETRTLTQFHFLSWPAEGTPASTRPLLDFRR